LRKFLLDQTGIEELAIRDVELSTPELLKDYNAPLKKLSIRKIDAEVAHGILKKCAGTLEMVEMCKIVSAEDVLKTIFQKCKLKTLKIHVSCAPDDAEFYKTLGRNTSINHLVLKSYKRGEDKRMSGLIGNLPNLKKLLLFSSIHITNELMRFISTNATVLEELHVHRLDNNCFINVSIPTLECLHMNVIQELSSIGWVQITKGCANLKRLIVDNIDNCLIMDEAAVRVIASNLPHLEELFLGRGFMGRPTFFRGILIHYPNLKAMTIYFKSIEDYPGVIKSFQHRPGFRFKQLEFLASFDVDGKHEMSTWRDEDVSFNSNDSSKDSKRVTGIGDTWVMEGDFGFNDDWVDGIDKWIDYDVEYDEDVEEFDEDGEDEEDDDDDENFD